MDTDEAVLANTGAGEESLTALFHERFAVSSNSTDKTASKHFALPFPDSRLRSILWRFLLLSPPGSKLENIASAVQSSRTSYSSLHKTYVAPLLETVPQKPEIESESSNDVQAQLKEALEEDHPLNPSSSHWALLRASEVLRQEIAQDVERCMPEDPFFRDPDVQTSLGDLIFVWCREHVEGVEGYRQGMHELAGMVMSVVNGDAAVFGHVEDEGEDVRLLKEILDPKFVEHDTYALFSRVMDYAREWYFVNGKEDEDSPMLATSRRIFYEMLPKADPELAAHLNRLDVLPQIFLMRWVRLLFGREFKSGEVQQMWDLFFSYSRKNGELERAVDGTCLIMVLRIRWDLLESDTNGALTLLLRYPPLDDSSTLKPMDFVKDGKQLVDSLGQEIGASIIEKYTDRRPAPYVAPEHRPSTPSGPFLYPATSILGRARSPFAGTSGSSSATLESLISEAAKGVLRSGERWGVNQAVRDVVRGIQQHAVTSSMPSTPPRYAPPGGRRRPLGGVKSETHGVIAANVLRRMNALEERNKRLAGMLDEGVQELWKLYEEMSEKSPDQDGLDRMCRSVAKVQFVQAFLKDMTLPLPDDEEKSQQKIESEQKQEPTVSEKPKETMQSPSGSQVRSSTPQARGNLDSRTSTPTRKPFERMSSPPRRASVTESTGLAVPKPSSPDAPNTILGTSLPVSLSSSMPTNHQAVGLSQSPSKSPDRSPSSLRGEDDSTLTPSKLRRPLAESSFSWMLADSASATDGSPSFTRATSFAPNERRTQAVVRGGRTKGKGFLFGDDPLNSDGAASGPDEVSDRGRRGSRRKDAAGDKDEGTRKEYEEIGLDDVVKDQ